MSNNESISFKAEIIRSRRKSIGIRVTRDMRVIVRAPLWVSRGRILSFVEEKRAWIEKSLVNVSGEKTKKEENGFATADFLPLYGNMVPVKKEDNISTGLTFENGTFILRGSDHSDRTLNGKAIKKWILERAKRDIPERVSAVIESIPQHSFQPTQVTVRIMKSRWGSCSSSGRITLNACLISLPPVCLDYVIIHELCHLEHRNHGTGFYRLLESIVPDYKAIRRTMKSWQWVLSAG